MRKIFRCLICPYDPDESPKLDQNMTTLAISLDPIDDMLDKGFESLVRAGRARRRGEAGRPRGRTPRIINRNQMTMNMDRNMEKKLLPQENRTPSDRRASLTVPEACPSLSHEGLSPLLPTGGEENLATLGTHSESDRDPLDLTFVGCSTSVELDDPENPNPVDAGIEAPVFRDAKANVKRKAKTSPEINSFSDGEGGHGGETPNRSTISLRKLKSRKKRPHTRAAGRSPSLEVPPAEKMSTESEKGTDSDSNKARKTHKKSLGSKNSINESSVVLSSDDEEVGKDFAPQELRIMGANSVGAMGLDYLANIESMRSRSRNLQGGISGKMRKDIEKTKDVINTLIYKS